MLQELYALLRREFLRWVRSPIWIFTSLLLPILYLILFGQGFGQGLNQCPPPLGLSCFLGAPNYFSFFSVGMVGFVALTMSLFSGANIIFDKGAGIIKRQVATPAPRSALFLSPLLFRSLMGLVPAFLVLGLAVVLAHVPGFVGLTISHNPGVVGALEIVAAVVVLSLMFNALFLAFGFALESPNSYFGIVNMLNLPILFLSNALYPPLDEPGWLLSISTYNPVSLCINVMRINLFGSGAYYAEPAAVYLAGLLAWAALFLVAAVAVGRRAMRTP
ncbi:MAG: ABC transporter permease [Thermoplasmata archaeon]